jgi:hypothetical protein
MGGLGLREAAIGRDVAGERRNCGEQRQDCEGAGDVLHTCKLLSPMIVGVEPDASRVPPNRGVRASTGKFCIECTDA